MHGEDRIAITPEYVKKYIKLGFSVLIEKDAGINSSFSNKAILRSRGLIVEDKLQIIKELDILIQVLNT